MSCSSLFNRQKLDSKNVSLENVIIKEAESMLVGTVKVRNLSFRKEVFVRSTWDNWKTQQDTICTYTPVSGEVSRTITFLLTQSFSFYFLHFPLFLNVLLNKKAKMCLHFLFFLCLDWWLQRYIRVV